MSKLVLTDVSVTIATVDLSDHVGSVTLTTSVDEVETTAFGSTARTRVGGLKDNSVSLEFHQNFAATEVEATIYPLIGSTATVVIKPTSGSASSTNPSFTFTALISEWSSLDGAIGDLATTSVTWPISGTITKGTA